MKKTISFVFGVLVLIPAVSFAQITNGSDNSVEIAALWQEVYQLEQQIQLIISQEQVLQDIQHITPTPISTPTPNPVLSQEAQNQEYYQSCINVDVANQKETGDTDVSQMETKAIYDCRNQDN